MCLLTKLDEALILYKRKSGGPSSLVRRIIGGTREEDARHFLGKMKKMSFSLEKKEKKCIFAFGNQRRAPLYERQALFIRKAHQTTQVLHARMPCTLQTKV